MCIQRKPCFGSSSANREEEHYCPQQPEYRGCICNDRKSVGPDSGESSRRTDEEKAEAPEYDSNRSV